MVVLANGLMHASATGVLGLEKGFWLAWRSVEFYGKMMLQWGPELVMAGAAFPVIQVSICETLGISYYPLACHTVMLAVHYHRLLLSFSCIGQSIGLCYL